MAVAQSLVVFSLDEQRYALALDCVQRTIRAVAVTPVPKAPPLLCGIIDLGGAIIPVINMRECLNHPQRTLRLSDQIIIATAENQTVALLVDETMGVTPGSEEATVPVGTILARLDIINGAVQHPDGLILVLDLPRLLSLGESAIHLHNSEG